MSEVRITVSGEGGEEKNISAPVGAGFLQLLKMNGHPLTCCNGKGSCGRCRIQFLEGAPLPTASDRLALTPQQLREGYRLSLIHILAAKLILQDAVGEGDTILIDVKDGELCAAAK